MARALLAALLLTAPVAVLAQPVGAPHPTAALTWLTGQWRGGGMMFGRPSVASLTIAPVLGGRFLEFSYRAGGFEGRAFYRPAADGGWQAQWFDNRGMSFPIAARMTGQELVSEWGSAETERGRTVYRLGADGRLTISDSGRRPDGEYREFASHILTRAN